MAPLPPLAADEPCRLMSLRKLNLIDTPLEERFERITRLIRRIMSVKIAAVSLVEADRQFFKSIQGLQVTETPRDVAFCAYTILADDLLVVPDARKDPRFADNPLVTGEPGIVFYAGCPLHAPDGFRVGSLCVIDSTPRQLTEQEGQTLRDLAQMIESELAGAKSHPAQSTLVQDTTVDQRRDLVDPVTRLWNREAILGLAREVIDTDRLETGCGLIVLSVNGVDPVNDERSQPAGEQALVTAARRILQGAGETDLVGRVGNNEFLVIVTHCDSPAEAKETARRVLTRMTESDVDADSPKLSVGVGIRFVESGSVEPIEEHVNAARAATAEGRSDDRPDASWAAA